MGEFIVYFIFITLLMIVIGLSIKVIQTNQVMIVERLGAYYKTLETGIHFIFPTFDRVVCTLTLDEQLHKTVEQSIRTFDDKSINIKVNLFYSIIDPKLYHYGFNRDFSKLDETIFGTVRQLLLKNRLDDIKVDLYAIDDELKQLLNEEFCALGLKVMKANIVI